MKKEIIIRAGFFENASDLETEEEAIFREFIKSIPEEISEEYFKDGDIVFSHSDGMFSARIPLRASIKKWSVGELIEWLDARRGA